MDTTPQLSRLEIDGHPFTVLRYDHDTDEYGIVHDIVLRLTPDELDLFRCLCVPKPVQVKRIGIDDVPTTLHWAGPAFWSKHTGDGVPYYKQIARLVSAQDRGTGEGLVKRFADTQEAQKTSTAELAGRFTALLNQLVENGALTSEQRDVLGDTPLTELLNDTQLRTANASSLQVADAENML